MDQPSNQKKDASKLRLVNLFKMLQEKCEAIKFTTLQGTKIQI